MLLSSSSSSCHLTPVAGVSPVVGDHLFAVFLTFMNNLVAFYSAQLLAAVCSSAEVRQAPTTTPPPRSHTYLA